MQGGDQVPNKVRVSDFRTVPDTRCRLAIRAAKFGPEADFLSRAVGEDPTPLESQRQRKKRENFEGALREQ
jgi:hypothetical protein